MNQIGGPLHRLLTIKAFGGLQRTRSLQTCNNALLVSLAANDLLNCSVYTPLLLFSFLHYGMDSQVSMPVCSVQQFTYALCSCVQLLTLVGISVERFQAIAFPFQSERRKARVCYWILFIWACGIILAVISLTLPKATLFYMLCRLHADKFTNEHLTYWDPFGPYILVPVWGLSLAVIIVHYARILRVVRQHHKKVLHLGVQLQPAVSALDFVRAHVPVEQPTAADRVETLPRVGSSSPLTTRHTALLDKAGVPHTSSSPGGESGQPPEIVGAVCLLTPEVRQRGKAQMEGRLAQRFGYIMIAFTLLWLPMVVILLMSIISWETDKLLMKLETSAMVLTCVQAAVDPVIYTLVTRQFRSELRKIVASIPGCSLKLKG
ncbi:5-hydroxytryptamine receptor 1D-like [Brachionichthys hirsutus]|uniref:5-hydroxytryptamine receptor 1D-like n=1 Tax=Brachionichthys hirsutus TaxID=412623 RepID=UPI003604457A